MVVHYFAHVAAAHLAVYRDRLLRLRDSVVAVLRRNPQVDALRDDDKDNERQ